MPVIPLGVSNNFKPASHFSPPRDASDFCKNRERRVRYAKVLVLRNRRCAPAWFAASFERSLLLTRPNTRFGFEILFRGFSYELRIFHFRRPTRRPGTHVRRCSCAIYRRAEYGDLLFGRDNAQSLSIPTVGAWNTRRRFGGNLRGIERQRFRRS